MFGLTSGLPQEQRRTGVSPQSHTGVMMNNILDRLLHGRFTLVKISSFGSRFLLRLLVIRNIRLPQNRCFPSAFRMDR